MLTFVEYNELIGESVDEARFTELIGKAEQVIDSVTRHFYQFHDLETDIEFRKKQVKLAIAYQVQYFDEVGATTSEGITSRPQSVSLGRTSISSDSRQGVTTQQGNQSIVCEDAYNALHLTGLLNRGVDS